MTSGTVSLCTVSGIEEGGTVPYCTESERTGTVTATSDFCSKSKCDLLSVVGEIELIFCFTTHNYLIFCFVDLQQFDEK